MQPINPYDVLATHGVVVYENFSALPGRYELLFSHAGKTSLFHTLPWYPNFVQTVLAPHDRMRIYAIDVDRAHEVDYLTGGDAHKKDWLSDRRERWGIVAFNPRSPKGLLAALFHPGTLVAGRAIDAVRHLRGPGELRILQSDWHAPYPFAS